MAKKIGFIGSRYYGGNIHEILKMLGGKSVYNWGCSNNSNIYYLDVNNTINAIGIIHKYDFKTFTYDEFKEKYPFELDDIVLYQNKEYKISGMAWDLNSECIVYHLEDDMEENFQNSIRVEELIKYNGKIIERGQWHPCDFSICNGKRIAFVEDKTELILNDNFEIIVEDGKTFVVRKQPIYPRTYEQCCDIVGAFNHSELVYKITDGYDCPYDTLLLDKLNSYRKLLICRNAYWKICNYQPNWNDDSVKHYIQYSGNDLIKDEIEYGNKILAFPTSEMRDIFYDNFSELIERCKDLI